MSNYPNWKVDALIAGRISIDSSWTERDFADLALAAADQSGMSMRNQDRVAELVHATRQRIRAVR